MIQLENLVIVLPIGFFSIGLTLYLILLGNRDKTDKSLTFDCCNLHIFSKQIDMILVMYLFLIIMIAFIGFLSNFIIPSIVGFIFSVIPAFLIVVAKRNHGGD